MGELLKMRTADPTAKALIFTQYNDTIKFLTKQHCALSPRTVKSVQAEGRTTNNYIYKGNPDKLAEAFHPKWGGALPLTLLVEPGGKVAWSKQGEFEFVELRRAIIKWLDVNG